MRVRTDRFPNWLWMAIGVLSAVAAPAAAVPPYPASPPRAASPARAPSSFPKSQLAAPVQLGSWVRSHERNDAAVKSAFREVIEAAGESTVEVLCDGQRTALGVITHADGYVLTKYSELTGQNLACRTKDGRRLPAEVVAVHAPTDLAMLRVRADNLKPVRFSENEPPPIGSLLATPGLGESPVAIGIVSAPPRRVPSPNGVLGVMLGDAEAGPLVEDVLPGSAAEAAGVQAGDVIVQVNDARTENRRALVSAIRGHHPGERILLEIVRQGKRENVLAQLRAGAGEAIPGSLAYQNRMGGRLSARRTGFPLALQHDSVLRPSDCGGPIVDLDGQVVGVNIARSGRVASLALPAAVVTDLLDDMQAGKMPPPAWSLKAWDSQLRQLGARIASLEASLREAEDQRREAHLRLVRSETAVRQALVERAAAELRKVDAREDAAKRLQAETERRAAERAVQQSATPFEAAKKEMVAANEAIDDLRAALATARREQANLTARASD